MFNYSDNSKPIVDWMELEKQFDSTSSGTPNRDTARRDLRALGIEALSDTVEEFINKF
jgi:hypothetical protein